MISSATTRLERAMARADSYDEWREAARAHDRQSGMYRWKQKDTSRHYDHETIRVRLDCLRDLRGAGDNRGLLFTLNEGIHGNLGGMGRFSLYDKARFGTKQLIVDYVDEVASALDYLASSEVSDISFEEKLDFFRRADHCFGRTAFMMSGSGSLIYFHVGVVKALLEQNLLPGVLSGSSGGSFVGSLLCTHTDDELENMFEPENMVYEIEQEARFVSRLSRLKPRFMRVDQIQEMFDRLIPDLTFQEAFERSGRQLNISIAAAQTHQKSRLLNAITSPNVFIREAIQASTAVPGVYPPVTLAAKNHMGEKQDYLPNRKWVDGSVSDDLPAKRLARLYGVNHYIVSQTNPHVIPFVADGKRREDTLSLFKDASISTARAWVNAGANSMQKPLSYSPYLARFTNIALSVINQDYIGDINILPPYRFQNPLKLLAHRSIEEVMELVRAGEKASWPKIEMIRIQTKISRTLDKILRDYDDHHVQHIKAALRRRAG
jgi:NTE family protein